MELFDEAGTAIEARPLPSDVQVFHALPRAADDRYLVVHARERTMQEHRTLALAEQKMPRVPREFLDDIELGFRKVHAVRAIHVPNSARVGEVHLRWRLPADRVADWRVQRIGRVLRSDDDRRVVLPPGLQAILEGVVELLDLECVPRL